MAKKRYLKKRVHLLFLTKVKMASIVDSSLPHTSLPLSSLPLSSLPHTSLPSHPSQKYKKETYRAVCVAVGLLLCCILVVWYSTRMTNTTQSRHMQLRSVVSTLSLR
jgi:hypothetical protein